MLGHLGRRRERIGGIHHKHNQGIEIARAAAKDFHRRAGIMSKHGLAGVDMAHAMRRLLAQLAGEHVEGFGTRMSMHWRLDPWRSARLVDAQQILRRSDWGHGPDLGHLAATWRRSTLRTEREEPNLARHFGGKSGRAGYGLR